MSEGSLFQTVFHHWHVAAGARMVEFGGWHMPVQYSTIVEEHHAVRHAAGLFDVAHMGRLQFTGPDACRFLDHVLTNDVSKLKVGQVRYALVTNEAGFVLDDVLVYRLNNSYLLVVNASNRQKIWDWLQNHRGGFDVTIDNLADSHAMLAMQGARAAEVIRALEADALLSLKYYQAVETAVLGYPAIASRTGYTGEDGFEIIAPANQAIGLWEKIISAGKNIGLVPAGLGCRDTLRLEAAMPLYGHELDEATDPLTAGLNFAVKLQKPDFIGKSALHEVESKGASRKRVGLQLAGRRIAREGSQVMSNNQAVGTVTSGTFSPTLECSIAMAYVPVALSVCGTKVQVDIRGKQDEATVVDLPFYSAK